MKKTIIVKIGFLIMFVVFVGLAINQFYQYKKSDIIYDQARERYNLERAMIITNENLINQPDNHNPDFKSDPETSEEPGVPNETQAPEGTTVENPENNSNKTDPKPRPSIAEAGDVIGWLTIPGTAIDYPVTQTTDNDFYLTHNYLGNKDVKGSIYMDFRNEEIGKSRNYNIYGHKMIDGTMFSDLTLYVQDGSYKRYFENYNIIKYDNMEFETEWKIFSAYVVNLDKEDYYLYTKYSDDENFQAFIDEINRRSLVKTDIDVGLDDQIITLVTCNFWYDNARVIIHAVRIN
ncbi:MAG: Sortase B [Clostridiales bacterium 38_11]|nr:MAG: Sortase B [Clostridiales bacterium 38_11]